MRFEVGAHRIGEALAILVFAQRVDKQTDLAQTDVREEPPRQRDDLYIQIRIVAAECLDTDLVEGPVAATLWSLVTEVRTGVEDLPGKLWLVLHECPDDTCGHLRTKRYSLARAVLEVVHLLGDHICGLPHPREHPHVLEQRGNQLPVPGAGRIGNEQIHEAAASRGLGPQHVSHSGEGLELLTSGTGHGAPTYRAAAVVLELDWRTPISGTRVRINDATTR